jgi:hypothetical protein
MPDFAQVYNFLGSVFDPDKSGHLQRLKAMDPIDVETVCLLECLLLKSFAISQLYAFLFKWHYLLYASYVLLQSPFATFVIVYETVVDSKKSQ